MSNNLDQSAPRPTIITVFAILTLIACGFSLIFALVPDNIFNGSGDVPSPPRDPAFQIADVAMALVKIAGAIFILQMRKIGFYIYTIAEIGVVGLLLYTTKASLDYYDLMIFPSDLALDPAILIIITAIVLIISSIVWVGVYASQLKNMR